MKKYKYFSLVCSIYNLIGTNIDLTISDIINHLRFNVVHWYKMHRILHILSNIIPQV